MYMKLFIEKNLKIMYELDHCKKNKSVGFRSGLSVTFEQVIFLMFLVKMYMWSYLKTVIKLRKLQHSL